MNKTLPPALSRPIAVAVGLLACGVNLNALAHGYVSEPEGRSYLCKLGDNTGCGAVQWEPQSVEGPDGNPRFPIEGPRMAQSLPPVHPRGQSLTRRRRRVGISMTLPRVIKHSNGRLRRITHPETGDIL